MSAEKIDSLTYTDIYFFEHCLGVTLLTKVKVTVRSTKFDFFFFFFFFAISLEGLTTKQGGMECVQKILTN